MADVERLMIGDPLETVDIAQMVKRTGIPRNTIIKWLAEDEANKTPGRRFPRALQGHKFRWNVQAVAMWFARYHAGEKVA